MHSSGDFTDFGRRESPMYCRLGEEVRTICSQDADHSNVRFLAATNKLEGKNKVFSIEKNESDSSLSLQVIEHPLGPVIHISCSPTNTNLFATTHEKVCTGHIQSCAQIWTKKGEKTEAISNVTDDSLGQVACTEWEPSDGVQLLVTTQDHLVVWDTQEDRKREYVPCTSIAYVGRWDCLGNGRTVGVASGSTLELYDLRNSQQIRAFKNAHYPVIRNFDFNPTRIYELATCGDDGTVKVWDSRNHVTPLCTFDTQGHWVWTVRYNPSYENLMATGGSDSSVRLYCIPNENRSSTDLLGKDATMEAWRQSPVVRIYDEHEESVYALEWSQCDCWYFASASFDGCVTINRVPGEDQVNTLLMSDEEDVED